MKDTIDPPIRSWAEQKAAEKSVHHALRRDWIVQLASLGLNMAKSAEMVGMNRSTLCKEAKLFAPDIVWVTNKDPRPLPQRNANAEYLKMLKAGCTLGEAAAKRGVKVASVVVWEVRTGHRFPRVRMEKPGTIPPEIAAVLTDEEKARFKALTGEMGRTRIEALQAILGARVRAG